MRMGVQDMSSPGMSSENSVLVVVDMQPVFKGYRNILQSCIQLVQSFARRKQNIIYVEYDECGNTISDLTKETIGFHEFVTKYRMGGGDVVAQKLSEFPIHPKDIYVCGCYNEMCVIETSCELAALLPNLSIQIVTQCCQPFDKRFRWSKFIKPYLNNYSNLRLL